MAGRRKAVDTAPDATEDARTNEQLNDPWRFVPQAPHPKQQLFLDLRDCYEVFFGGAAGGGKSSALLMAACEYVHLPHYAALIVRRTCRDLSLPGALLDRANEWFGGTDAKYNGTNRRWTFPSGANINFGYCDTLADVNTYMSSEFQFIGVDEATQIPGLWCRRLLSRLRRRVGLEVPLRVRYASNPGGVSHEWFYDRFVDWLGPGSKAEAGEVRWYQDDKPVEVGTPEATSRSFVPAGTVDNPSLGADYEMSLNQLDEDMRRRLKYGSWERSANEAVYPWQG